MAGRLVSVAVVEVGVWKEPVLGLDELMVVLLDVVVVLEE